MGNNELVTEPRSGTVVQSVDRALSIMEILARDDWSGVTEIAKELGIHKSTVFRLVSTLERRGFVVQHADTQKYRLGFAVVRLASGVRYELDLTQVARPVCERLSEWSGETVNLAVLEGGEVVNVDQVNLSTATVSVNWIGRRSALHATSTGKVFLAYAPEQVLERYIRRGLSTLTEHTITDAAVLRQHLDEVRQRGYASALEELEVGLHAVAAPVFGHEGDVVAAVGVSGPSYRLVPERIDEVGRLTADGGLEISRGLGYLGVPRPAET
jgi:IclR family transcriptional regulator, acetate operon repressor